MCSISYLGFTGNKILFGESRDCPMHVLSTRNFHYSLIDYTGVRLMVISSGTININGICQGVTMTGFHPGN